MSRVDCGPSFRISVSYLSPYSHNRILLSIMDEDSWISSVPVLGSAYSRKTMSTSRLYVAKPSGILLGGYLSLCCDLLTLRWYSQTAEVRALFTFIVTWIHVIIQPHWCQSIRIHHWPSPKAPRWNDVYMVYKTFLNSIKPNSISKLFPYIPNDMKINKALSPNHHKYTYVIRYANLRMYMHLRTPTTAAMSPPTTVKAITKARNKNKMADIFADELTSQRLCCK